MSDTQDDLDKRIEAVKQFCGCDERSSVLVDAVVRTCRAHFQRQAEPVAESTKTNLIDESGGYWVDGEFRIEGKDLDAMLDRLYTSPPIPADMVMVPRVQATYRVFKDGNAWCAVGDGFINLQESLAEFAETPPGALARLLTQEALLAAVNKEGA